LLWFVRASMSGPPDATTAAEAKILLDGQADAGIAAAGMAARAEWRNWRRFMGLLPS